MKNYLLDFCNEFEYPCEATEALAFAYDKIFENKAEGDIFAGLLEGYQTNKDVFPSLDSVAGAAGIHRYTVHLLFYICLSQYTRRLYEQRQIPYEIFFDSMSDLKWKLLECHDVYGIWGSFVADWFVRFFDLTRFTLGRLQFETIEFNGEYSKNGNTLHEGDTVLNIHIPSAGPLKHEACIESYKKAASFYKDCFIDRPTAFVCDSWLLFPGNREILPEKSNIRLFMEDFDIISESDNNFGDLWRIFNKEYTGSTADLPRDTHLRRAYADWISKGNRTGVGMGVFFFDKDNAHIVSKK